MTKFTAGFLAIVGGMIVLSNPIIAHTTVDHVIAVVEKSERVCTGGQDGTCKYLVFTNKGVFENTDTIWFLKYGSSDVYAQLKPGHTYQLKVTGWRVPFFSWYRNIISAQNA